MADADPVEAARLFAAEMLKRGYHVSVEPYTDDDGREAVKVSI
jgi:hypothetical protein